MRWLSGGYPAAGDTFWSGVGGNRKKVHAELKAPPGWQVIAALAIYAALVGLIGVMLAG